MSYEDLVQKSPWHRFSDKMAKRILKPLNCGHFTEEDASARMMRRVSGEAGFLVEGNALSLYWLVDPSDGVIVDARFQVFGQAALIGAAEAACDLLIYKNYDQARRIGVDLIDKWMRDHPDRPAFPEETLYLLNLVLEAIDDASEKCSDLPLSPTYVSPLPESGERGTGHPDWLSLSHEHKLLILEKILNEDVRPYVELDEGGIEILSLNGDELTITYQGSCTSCFSAIGATLSTIQQIIQSKAHPELKVIPNMDALNL